MFTPEPLVTILSTTEVGNQIRSTMKRAIAIDGDEFGPEAAKAGDIRPGAPLREVKRENLRSNDESVNFATDRRTGGERSGPPRPLKLMRLIPSAIMRIDRYGDGVRSGFLT